MLKLAYYKLLPLVMTLFITSCGLDTQVKQFQGTVNPAETRCEHPDADNQNPICEKYISACVFYACKISDDPNYSKYLEYEAYIQNLKGDKAHSTIIHDANKCANKGSKIESVVFSIEPSAAGFVDENLGVQPEVSILKENGQVAVIALPVTLSVHKNNTCSDTAVSSSEWSMGSSNPVTTVAGKHLYSNLKFLAVGSYYLKAESPGLLPDCSVKIEISKDLSKAKGIIFVDPKPSTEGLHSRDLVKQPITAVVNELGDILPQANVSIGLSLHNDDKCLSLPVLDWEADANPVLTAGDGKSVFGGVAIKKGGSFYLRASSLGLASACFGPIKVADRLKFTQTPSLVSIKDVLLPQQPIVGVAHQDGVNAPFAEVAVKLSIYTDAQCSVVAAAQDYEILDNTIESNASGLSNFAGLKFKKEMKFYVRGESLPLLPTDCVPVDVGSSVKKVIFLVPLPSQNNERDVNFPVQPKVGLVDENGDIIPEEGKNVQLTLHSDNACATAAISQLDANTNPGLTVAGVYQFSGVNVNQGGVFYLKAGSPGLQPTCYGPVNVADRLKLEQSTSGQAGVALAQQPEVKVVLPSGSILPISGVPVTYKVYTDAACTQLASPNSWSMNSVNPVNTNASGIAQFIGVTINDVGVFYSKATTTHPLDPSACLKIDTASVASRLSFAEPYFPQLWVKNKLLSPQPSVEARDANGNLASVNIPVELSLHESSDCASAALAQGSANFWEVSGSPNATTNGKITFAGVKIFKAGKYYFKAKTSTAGIASACSFAIEVADKLKYDPAPSGSVVQNKPLTIDPIVKTIRGTNTVVALNNEKITLSVYKDSACAQTPVASGDWSVGSANPANTLNGEAVFSGISFKNAGTYYIKASHPELDPVCSGVVTVLQGASKIIFIDPTPSIIGQVNIPLPKQPYVALVDGSGNVITNDDKDVKISLATDVLCTQEVPSFYTVDAPNPALTSQGKKLFSGFTVKKGGLFYIKAASPGLESACFGPIEIADGLSFVVQPSTPHSILSNIPLNPVVGVVRPNNILVPLSNIPITLDLYKDSTCTTNKFVYGVDWKVSETNPKNTTDGKSTYTNFDLSPLTFSEYYIRATAPGLSQACSAKFVIQKPSVGGCMEPTAENFNPLATSDDCSCSFKFCPLDKPTPDSAQGSYDRYKNTCSKAVFENSCVGSCEEKKDPIQALANTNSGYVYQCDKYKAEYDKICTDPNAALYSSVTCSVHKANYEACYRRKNCSKLGIVDDAASLAALHAVYPGVYAFNSPNSQFTSFDIPASFDSLCIKMRFPGTLNGLSQQLKDYYENNCDCTECEDPGTCNHPGANDFKPSTDGSSFCDSANPNWPTQDFASFIATLPNGGPNLEGEKICFTFHFISTQCNSIANQGSKECNAYANFVKDCSTGSNTKATFYGVTCDKYSYFVQNCGGKCTDDGGGDPEGCSFKACMDSRYKEYEKYREYKLYCQKAGVTCDIQSDPSLCRTMISGPAVTPTAKP